jgi:CRISPR/Cas system endoribonuclease Cas6 (RAMP superfamily)
MKTHTYSSGKTITFTDKFFYKFLNKNVYFLFQGVVNITLYDNFTSVDELLNHLLELTENIYTDQYVGVTKSEYKEKIYNTIYDINLDSILDKDFNQTVFYALLVINGYIKEIN